jgi:hypothetical protein
VNFVSFKYNLFAPRAKERNLDELKSEKALGSNVEIGNCLSIWWSTKKTCVEVVGGRSQAKRRKE